MEKNMKALQNKICNGLCNKGLHVNAGKAQIKNHFERKSLKEISCCSHKQTCRNDQAQQLFWMFKV